MRFFKLGFSNLKSSSERVEFCPKAYAVGAKKWPVAKLAIPDMKSFEHWYIRVLSEKLSTKSSQQQFWSKAIAVGDEEWLKATAI
jgi:hypothetical protein